MHFLFGDFYYCFKLDWMRCHFVKAKDNFGIVDGNSSIIGMCSLFCRRANSKIVENSVDQSELVIQAVCKH